jgi:glycerate 2-kinase
MNTINMKLKILVSTDKYKGSLSAIEVCNTIKKSIMEVDRNIEVIISPMADGGEGTVGTLVESYGGKYISLEVTGPLGRPVRARFGLIKEHTAIIEMASASGLVLVPQGKRNPMEATTYGTGELIKKALNIGCKKVIVGIGGSATNDGGLGMAQALGYKFYNREGKLLGRGGKELVNLYKIDASDIHKSIPFCQFDVACDVTNPLTGSNGAAYVYAPQKGADGMMVKELDRGLTNFAEVVKKELGKDVGKIKGAGAAGGLGAGLAVFLNANLRPGTDIIIEATGLEDKIKDADLVITGEGALDMQTFFGKGAFGVAKLAKKYNKPVITINGSVLIDRNEIDRKYRNLTDGNFSIINKPLSLKEAVENAEELLGKKVKELITFYLSIKK